MSAAFMGYGYYNMPTEADYTHLSNWSATRHVRTHNSLIHHPSSLEELEEIVAKAAKSGMKMRPVGSALSPNGIAFEELGMVQMALMDKVISVDPEKMECTVEAGIRIDQLVEALRPYNLTLPNYASIREQQVGGFTQVGAHGSGAAIAPADEYVVAMKLVTPEMVTLDIGVDKDPHLFHLARHAMGMLGIAAHLTLRLVPAHQLIERSFATTPDHVARMHTTWLSTNRHLRYHWIPHTDTVVVTAANPVGSDQATAFEESVPRAARVAPGAEGKPLVERAAELLGLYQELASQHPKALPPLPDDFASSGITYVTLRDRLYAVSPLDTPHVRRVNSAVASYHKNTPVCRVDWSDQILGFDCGGQQWVCEVAFQSGFEVAEDAGADYAIQAPVAGEEAKEASGSWSASIAHLLTRRQPPKSCLSTASVQRATALQNPTPDLVFISDLYQLIHDYQIPAHEPLEQRWTAPSASPISAAYSNPRSGGRPVFCWVGIMQYLPTLESGNEANEKERQAISQSFSAWRHMCGRHLWPAYGALEHWGKVEVPIDPMGRQRAAQRVKDRFGAAAVEEVGRWRGRVDPKGCLGNADVDALWPIVKGG
ncbi:FAD-binding domain-containing protein [Gonapodya prolifera JEL478]|uniref:D-arabinono-1,4-lactone oxidase n=1 Tax=Gonapodya prolifera (strain JEL478) TaxID=1344416 RepID=A0A139AI89_GONPJ|nr:FAD-binding domain-containing protein [Gonapodya prolifera JEL478]|eukprot:KXS16522.1 FAD-binding domain-containing protein [Gonapodya prolifera JEL478]